MKPPGSGRWMSNNQSKVCAIVSGELIGRDESVNAPGRSALPNAPFGPIGNLETGLAGHPSF